jgi:hypothetical protein
VNKFSFLNFYSKNRGKNKIKNPSPLDALKPGEGTYLILIKKYAIIYIENKERKY